jgi:tetratricopeptide (TPR) repeat protein
MNFRLSFLAAGLAAVLLSTSAAPQPPMQDYQHDFEAGRYVEAIHELEAAIGRSPRDARLHFWLARSAFELSEFEAAVQSAERAVQLDPGNSDYQLWLGRASGRIAEIDSSLFMARKSRRAFEAAVRLDPANIPARRDLAEFYATAPWFLGGSKDKARQQVDEIARLDPVEGMLARAEYWHNLGQPDKEEEQYLLALEQKPRKMQAYYGALGFYEHRSNVAQIERILVAASAVNPSDPPLLYHRGLARVIAGVRQDEAEKDLKAYLKAVPNRSDLPTHGDAHEWLGKIREQRGDYRGAAEEYRAALKFEPHRKRFHEDLKRVEKKL